MMARDSTNNIELLRIISMFLVLTTHFWGHCIDLKEMAPFAEGYIFGWLSKGVSYISVNTFVLISSFFMCEKKFRTSRILILELQVLFYSIAIYGVLLCTRSVHFSIKDFVQVFLPTLTGEYWFVTVFLGLLVFHPFLNIAICAMNKRQHLILCIVLAILFSVIPNIFFFSRWLNFGAGYGIVWFITLYIFAAYIKKHIQIEKLLAHKHKLYCATLIVLILPVVSRIIIVLAATSILGYPVGGGLFYGNNTILCLLSTILVFLSFLTINIRKSNVITYLSSGSFAVYLISDNIYLASILWDYVRSFIDLSSIWMPFVVNAWLLIIYTACASLDVPRQYIQKLMKKKVNYIGAQIDNRIKHLVYEDIS